MRDGKDTGRAKDIAEVAEEEELDDDDDDDDEDEADDEEGDDDEVEEVEALEDNETNGDVAEGVETEIAPAVDEENGNFFSISSNCRSDDSINSAPLLKASPMYSVPSCNVLLI